VTAHDPALHPGWATSPSHTNENVAHPPAATRSAPWWRGKYGVVSRAQLRALGRSDGAVDGWVRSGRLHRIHRGVYAVGHRALTDEGRWLAAVLACGPGAVLSHRSAAALWGIRPAPRKVEVTVGRSRRGTAGVVVHRARSLPPGDVARRRGVPTTTLPRTIADLADVLSEGELARAVHQAEIAHALDAESLARAARGANGRRGAGRLARAMAAGPDRTRSELERRLLALCDEHGLPRPEVNETVAGLEADFVWRGERVVAETDGWAYHGTRRAFERDRERDQALTRAGYRPLRFTHRQVVESPAAVAATLRAALRPGRPRGR
jgi:very-short-patch-repair endonuclease